MARQKYDELFKQVKSIFEKNGTDAAFNYIEDYIDKNTNSPEIYLVRGEICLEIGLAEDALKDFSKAIELDANYADAYANRANIYLKLREPQKAISDCTKAIQLSQNDFEPYFNRGLAYASTGEFAKALADYNKVIELAPENTEAYAKCGFLHSKLGEVQEAIRNYEKFLELDPNNKNAKLIRDALSDLRNSKVSNEDTLSNTATKKPLIIIMIAGAFIGNVISIGSMSPKGDTEFWIAVSIGTFFGIGLGPFLKSVKKFLMSGSFKKNMAEQQSAHADKDTGCMYGLLFWAIGGFFILGWALIKSPFVAIFECLSQYSHRGRKFTEYLLGTDFTIDISKPKEPVKKPVSKKLLFMTILIVLGVVLAVIIWAVKNFANSNTGGEVEKQEMIAAITLGSFTDSRDNKTYKTTKIGSQTWMAENLNYNAKGSKCYGDNPANCQKYGRHYNWNAAIKACPKGWHLPTNGEWDALYRNADGTSGTDSPYESPNAGKHLKAKSGWNDFNGNSGNGLDSYGFAALPGGSNIGKFHLAGDNGYWWSASESNNDNAYYRFMLSESGRAGWNNKAKSLLLNVRCVED